MQTPSDAVQGKIDRSIKNRNQYIKRWESKQGVVMGVNRNKGSGRVRITGNFANQNMTQGRALVKRGDIEPENTPVKVPNKSDVIETDNGIMAAVGGNNTVTPYGIRANPATVTIWYGMNTQVPQDDPTPVIDVEMQDRPDIYPLSGYTKNATALKPKMDNLATKRELQLGTGQATLTTQRYNAIPFTLNSRNQSFPVPDFYGRGAWQPEDVGKGYQAWGYTVNDDEPVVNKAGIISTPLNRMTPVTKMPPLPQSTLKSRGAGELMCGMQPVHCSKIPYFGTANDQGTPPYKIEWLGVTNPFLPPPYRTDLDLQHTAMDQGTAPFTNPKEYTFPQTWVNVPGQYTGGVHYMPDRDYPAGKVGAVMGLTQTRFNETVIGANLDKMGYQQCNNNYSAMTPQAGSNYITEIHKRGMMYAAPDKIAHEGIGGYTMVGDSMSKQPQHINDIKSFMEYTRRRQEQIAEQADFPGVGFPTQ